MWAIVPLKYFDNAKSRLSDVLSSTERQLLVRTMARDVLRALSNCTYLQGILINSRESEVAALATEFGAEVFEEPEGSNLSDSVTLAGDWLVRERHATGTLIVHADIPLATSADFDELLKNHLPTDRLLTNRRGFSLVPDDEDLGTNCIVASPPNPITYRYDGKSFEPHLQAAKDAGFEPQVHKIPGLQLDIDTAVDLRKLLAAQNPIGSPAQTIVSIGETGTYLETSGIAQRLATPYSDG